MEIWLSSATESIRIDVRMKYHNLLIDFRSHEKKTKISIFVDVLDF